MFVKISLTLTAAFFAMAALIGRAPLASASEGAPPIAVSASHTSIALVRLHGIVVAQAEPSGDSADNDSNSDSSDSNDSASDNQNDDNEQSSDNDQMDQQTDPQVQAPETDAGEAGQLPMNSYPQQVNPNQ